MIRGTRKTRARPKNKIPDWTPTTPDEVRQYIRHFEGLNNLKPVQYNLHQQKGNTK